MIPATLTADFVPASELGAWVVAEFIAPTGSLYNPDHAHLSGCEIGFIWAREQNRKKLRRVIGLTEQVTTGGDPWQKGRTLQLFEDWFGSVPEFVITLDWGFCREADLRSVCALIDHELYHCAQAVNALGMPRFSRLGLPIYAIRGHDVEEFVGVVRRWGPTADVSKLVAAAAQPPQIAVENRSAYECLCGTCMARVGG